MQWNKINLRLCSEKFQKKQQKLVLQFYIPTLKIPPSVPHIHCTTLTKGSRNGSHAHAR